MASLIAHCEKLSLPLRRAVVVTSIPLLIALLWLLSLPLQLVYQSQVGWRRDAIATLARARGSQSQAELLSQQVKALPTAPIWNKFYSGPKAGAAGSMLQSDVGGVLNSVHASVQSLTPMRATEANGLTTIGLRVAATMTIDQLKSFFVGVGNHAHYLRIERLRVNAPQAQVPDQNVTLTVTVELYGVERVRGDLSAARIPAAPSGGA